MPSTLRSGKNNLYGSTEAYTTSPGTPASVSISASSQYVLIKPLPVTTIQKTALDSSRYNLRRSIVLTHADSPASAAETSSSVVDAGTTEAPGRRLRNFDISVRQIDLIRLIVWRSLPLATAGVRRSA